MAWAILCMQCIASGTHAAAGSGELEDHSLAGSGCHRDSESELVTAVLPLAVIRVKVQVASHDDHDHDVPLPVYGTGTATGRQCQWHCQTVPVALPVAT